MTENAIKGKFNGGKITYGYMIEANKSFQLDPAAPVVEEIFNRYANEENIQNIIDDLHGKGLNNNGKPFTYHFVNWLLKNRRYIGEYPLKAQSILMRYRLLFLLNCLKNVKKD